MCSSHTHGDLKSLPRCGGPRKTAPIVDEQIVQASLADCRKSAVQIAGDLGVQLI